MKVIKNEYIIINENNLNNIEENEEENEYIVLLNYNKYIDKIYDSFKINVENINDNILEQFKNDYNRCIFKINNKREKNIDIFLDYFEFLLLQYDENLYKFLMLCTQATMGTPIELLYKTIKNNNLYIGELKKKKSNLIFNILSNSTEIYLQISKILRFFYINKYGIDKTIKLIKIKIKIPFYSKEDVIIIYKILKNI